MKKSKNKKNRTVSTREPIELKTKQELLVDQFKTASEKCRVTSISVCNEFEKIDLMNV